LQKWAFKAKRTLGRQQLLWDLHLSYFIKTKAHSSVAMVDKWAHVSTAFFTQNSSYGNIWKAGQPYAEQSECYMVLLLTI
jgi:hypothetical protein